MVIQRWAGSQVWSSELLCTSVGSEEGRDPVKRAGQRIILLTPVKSSLKNPVNDSQVPLLLHSVDDHITFTGLCWTPWPQQQGQTLLSSGGEALDHPQVWKTWKKMGHAVQENLFFHGDLHGCSPLSSPRQVTVPHIGSHETNIFHTSYCVLATATYTLLVKYWLRLLQGEEWGGEGVPFTCLIYMSNIKTEMKHVADCLQSFMSGVEVSGPAHKSHCSFVAVATDLCDL